MRNNYLRLFLLSLLSIPIWIMMVLIHEFGHLVVIFFFNLKLQSIEYFIFSARIHYWYTEWWQQPLIGLSGGLLETIFLIILGKKLPYFQLVGIPAFSYAVAEMIYIYPITSCYIESFQGVHL